MKTSNGAMSLCLVLVAALGFGGASSPAAQPASPQHWWEGEPLRIIDVVTSFGQLTERTPAEWADLKSAGHYNAEHFELMDMIRGLDDQGFFFSSKLAGKKNQDYLRRYLPEARKRGIRVMIYFNVHWFTQDFGQRHREWLQVREDGTPLTGVYTTGTDFCVNSPWRDWVFQIVRDLCAYPINGIFYDGPIFFPDTCYCPWCREKYQKLKGGPLPSKKERRGKAARDLLEFQAQSLADFLHDSRAIIKAASPEIAFYMNGGERGGNWATARINRVLVREQDLLGSEGGFIGGDLTRAPVWKPGVTARLLESQAPDKPRIIFSAAGHKPWTFSLLPEPELRLLYAGTVANGAGVWFGMWPFEFAQPEMRTISEMNGFMAANGAFYRDTRSEAKVAILWSEASANFYSGSDAQLLELDRVPQRSEVGNLNAEFSGFADALIRAHVPFDVIDDQSIEETDLARYQLILLPNTACMSDRVAARIREYVRDGGGVFSSFETSLYDEVGSRRTELALSDVFGVSSANRIVGPKRWDFMKSPKPAPASVLLKGLQRDFIPCPMYHLQVSPRAVDTVLRFTRPLTGVYDGIPVLSDDPALVEHRFGKGTAVYFAGDLGNGINAFHLGEFMDLFGNVVRHLAPAQVTLEDAPGSIEVVLRSQEQGKRLLLHLINFTGEMTRPIRRIVPIENLRVSVAVPQQGGAVRTLMGRETLKATWTDGTIRFVLPRLNEYEVVVIE